MALAVEGLYCEIAFCERIHNVLLLLAYRLPSPRMLLSRVTASRGRAVCTPYGLCQMGDAKRVESDGEERCRNTAQME